MKEVLTKALEEVRCRDCHRLLFLAEADALAGAISIKCPRCKALNHLRPDRALS